MVTGWLQNKGIKINTTYLASRKMFFKIHRKPSKHIPECTALAKMRNNKSPKSEGEPKVNLAHEIGIHVSDWINGKITVVAKWE